MNAVVCSVVDRETLRTNAWLRIDLVALAAEHSPAAASDLSRELAAINTGRPAGDTRLYLGRETSGRLTCFVLTRWQPLRLSGKSTPAVQLVQVVAGRGSAASQGLRDLLDACRRDLAALDHLPSQPPVLWSTARLPIDFLSLVSHLDHAEPRYDGSYSLRGARIVHAVREQLGAGLGDSDDHPFVLRGAALNATEQAAAEIPRSARPSAPRYSLFEQLGVDSHRADQLIVIASTPLTANRRHPATADLPASATHDSRPRPSTTHALESLR